MRINQVDTDEILRELSERPLVAIDMILEAFASLVGIDNPTRRQELFNLFCQAILHYIGRSTAENDPQAELFDKNLSRQHRHFIAICLLRLLSVCEECFKTNNFVARAFDLFDEVLFDEFYVNLKIDKKEQTFLKQSKLKGIVSIVEDEVANIILALNSLDMLRRSGYRKTFMETISAKRTSAILIPFLPPGPLKVKLDDIFITVEDYLKDTELEGLQLFEAAKEKLERYYLEAEQYGTKYSCELFGALTKRLLDLLQKHFESNPISKPAHLVMMKMEKKYPFSYAKSSFHVSFIVKNEGPGHAFDVTLKLIADITLKRAEIYLGHLDLTSTVVEIPVVVDEPVSSVEIMGELSWVNFDKTEDKRDFLFDLEGQRADIDWDHLKGQNPYDLEPVTTTDELVGRKEILNKLLTAALAKHVGSSYIFGQKRVGKTSLVKTLKTLLTKSNGNNYIVLYLEAGEYVQRDAKTTVEQLGRRLCREIRAANDSLSSLDIPAFDGALSPLSEFLEVVLRLMPDYKILFILDEFDELPPDLYRRGPLADAFFLPLRSISGKPPIGVILVGGEKMEYILNYQGDRLNKFSPVRVDYFDREKHWLDFKDLVQKPVADCIEFSDAALLSLYAQTAGNPYFTKLICSALFDFLVERRDSHVTSKEVDEATNLALQKIASNSFQHFWEDGIFDTDGRVEEKTMQRRKVLVAFAEGLKQHTAVKKSAIIEQAARYGLTEFDVEVELQDFTRRQILILQEPDLYECKVPFFAAWLKSKGIREIIAKFVDPDLLMKQRKREEEAYVRPEEIVRLVKEKEFYYRGQHINEEHIRAWLNQFGSNSDQRLMFQLLQHLRFYRRSDIRAKLKEAHSMVISGLTRYLQQGKLKRDDILVSYLDNPGKSGAYYAKLYADEFDIYQDNVVERGKLKKMLNRLRQDTNIQALVFIDDFIGTGESSSKYFKSLAQECGDLIRNSNIQRIFFIALCGFVSGKIRLEETLGEINLPVKVQVCDLLDEADHCFSEKSQVFPDSQERSLAERIAYRFGQHVDPTEPLGYQNSQALVVFESSCPNNTLPIFWSISKNWLPLFRR